VPSHPEQSSGARLGACGNRGGRSGRNVPEAAAIWAETHKFTLAFDSGGCSGNLLPSMMRQAVLFDLDGTLLDSLADIGESMNVVLSELGFTQHSLSSYRGFVGDGVTMLARRSLPPPQRDEATVAACVSRMRDVYAGRLAEQTRPYDGITDLLDALESGGIAKAVLSNKPHDLTVDLVARLLGRWAFAAVFGERPGVARKPDPAGASEVAGLLGLAPSAIVYVGDTPTDMATARAAGMLAVGATWGFRDEAELREAGADVIVQHPAQVLDHLGARAASVR